MVTAKVFVTAKPFKGEPKTSDFDLVTEELPVLKDGQVLAEALYLSVDPYMSLFSSDGKSKNAMVGSQVARVVESKASGWKKGELLVGHFGWRSHTIFSASEAGAPTHGGIFKLPDFGGLSPSLGVGMLGMTGHSAHFGFLDICQPKQGQTVVVSGAAGAVGSHVGQIAKIKGCRVIGFAGSDDKVKWLTKDLGFDAAFNYKTKDIDQALKEAAPDGVDCYFDNVGGHISNAVFGHMKRGSRVCVVGGVSAYNCSPDDIPKTDDIFVALLSKEMRIEGFRVGRCDEKWLEGVTQNMAWIKSGQLKVDETVTKGFENTPTAFIEMLRGKNRGKAVVQV